MTRRHPEIILTRCLKLSSDRSCLNSSGEEFHRFQPVTLKVQPLVCGGPLIMLPWVLLLLIEFVSRPSSEDPRAMRYTTEKYTMITGSDLSD